MSSTDITKMRRRSVKEGLNALSNKVVSTFFQKLVPCSWIVSRHLFRSSPPSAIDTSKLRSSTSSCPLSTPLYDPFPSRKKFDHTHRTHLKAQAHSPILSYLEMVPTEFQGLVLTENSTERSDAEPSTSSTTHPSPASPPPSPSHPSLRRQSEDRNPDPGPAPSLLVFSGGTAFNSVAPSLQRFTTRVAHILPVSDDGGSTAEIVRVLGGPAVGDIRSRCIRLADESDAESRAVKALLAHRLSSTDPGAAKAEWYQIMEGDHELWTGISDAYKHTIRAFLVHFHTAILRHSTERFNFMNGSVGNFFFAGARLFFRSLEAAIFLFSRVARIPEGTSILPAILTEERITLGAELEDGLVIRGQNNISHPTVPSSSPSPSPPSAAASSAVAATSAVPNGPAAGVVDKSGLNDPPLTSSIRRIFYLSSEGTHQEHEVFPTANPRMLQQIHEVDAIVYGMGSLFTSVCPSLALRGVGEAIASRPKSVPKIVLLNGSHDRETRFVRDGVELRMDAAEVLSRMTMVLNRKTKRSASSNGEPDLDNLANSPSNYFTAVLYPRGGAIPLYLERLTDMGITNVLEVPSTVDDAGRVIFQPEALVDAIRDVVRKHAETI